MNGVFTNLLMAIISQLYMYQIITLYILNLTKIMASGPITSWQIDGERVETVSDFFGGGGAPLQMVTAAMKLKDACSLEEKL